MIRSTAAKRFWKRSRWRGSTKRNNCPYACGRGGHAAAVRYDALRSTKKIEHRIQAAVIDRMHGLCTDLRFRMVCDRYVSFGKHRQIVGAVANRDSESFEAAVLVRELPERACFGLCVDNLARDARFVALHVVDLVDALDGD